MRYIKDGIIYEQPIYITIGDTQLELDDWQLIELGYIPEYEVEEAMARDVENKINMPFNKLQILLDSITVQAPEGSKVGDNVISGLPSNSDRSGFRFLTATSSLANWWTTRTLSVWPTSLSSSSTET